MLVFRKVGDVTAVSVLGEKTYYFTVPRDARPIILQLLEGLERTIFNNPETENKAFSSSNNDN